MFWAYQDLRSTWPNQADYHCNVPKVCTPRGLNSHHTVPNTIQSTSHICSPMPPSKCPGCQQLFEDPLGFSNHKRQCCQVKVTIVQRLKEFQTRKDKGNRSLTQVPQAGDNSSRVEEGQGGPATIAVDGMPLVCLGLQLTLVQSDLSAIIRMRSPTSQPQNCVPLAD